MQSILQYRRVKGETQQKIRRLDAKETHSPSDSQQGADTVTLEASPVALPAAVISLRNGGDVRVPGVTVSQHDEKGTRFLVGFDSETDSLNPRNWPLTRKWTTIGIVGTTGFLVGWASAIDSAVIPQGQADFGVSKVVESLATSLFLIGFGLGSLIAAPFSEAFGRNPVYIVSLAFFMIFIMASGLAPNIGAQLAFRFLAGVFGSTPMTTFGGSTSDMFDPLARTYVFPVCSSLSFFGPFLAPLVGAFIGQSSSVSWRWSEWTSLIMAGITTTAISFLAPETYAPVLLEWKAKQLRVATGDDRFVAESEVDGPSLSLRLRQNCSRPFTLLFGELMVALFTLYLVVLYTVLFGFLTGYEFIFGEAYGFSQGTVGLTFIGMNIGFLVAFALVPHIYHKYKRALLALEDNDGKGLPPEQRLWYAMYGAPWLPISLFWMGWTNFPSVSYWSGLVASVAFGFSVQGIFISSYLYLIDTYEIYAASALVSLTLLRYLAAGVMVVVSIPMYGNLGVSWSLTLLGCLSLIMTPVPYIFYIYGHRLRKRSRTARA